MAEKKENGWNEYQKLVMSKLKDLGQQNKCQDKKIDNIRIDIATLKVKSGIWGAIAGCIPVLITLIGLILFGKL